MKTRIFNKLLAFLEKLEQQDINYILAHHREEAIMVLIAMSAPGVPSGRPKNTTR